jgi:hypothetical protein
VKHSNYGLQISNYGFQISNYGFQISNYGFENSNYGFQPLSPFEHGVSRRDAENAEVIKGGLPMKPQGSHGN